MGSSDTPDSPASVADEMSVDLSRCVTVDCEHSDGTYEILSEPTRERLQTEMLDAFSERDVSSVVRLSHSWKEGSYSDDGQTYERIFDAYLETSSPLRNGKLNGRAPEGEEAAVMGCWYELSQSFLTENGHGELVMYRGIHTYDGLVEALTSVFDSTSSTTPLTFTKVANFTTDRGTADYYGTSVITQLVSPSEVAFAADFLLPYTDDSGRVEKAEAEIRMIGEEVDEVDTADIYLPNSARTVLEAFADPTGNSPAEYDRTAGYIRLLADNDVEISERSSADLIGNWFDHYTRHAPLKALSLRADVESVIGRSLHP